MSKNGLIIFTRIPEAGKTKTRLQSKLSKEECANLHKCFLKDIYDIFLNLNDIDIIICHTEEGDLNILKNNIYIYVMISITDGKKELFQQFLFHIKIDYCSSLNSSGVHI